jgi:hypothetical protein
MCEEESETYECVHMMIRVPDAKRIHRMKLLLRVAIVRQGPKISSAELRSEERTGVKRNHADDAM